MKLGQVAFIVLALVGIIAVFAPLIHYNIFGSCSLTVCESGVSRSVTDYYFGFGLQVVYFTKIGGGDYYHAFLCPWGCT